MPAGVQIAPFDITLDGHRYGELFDFTLLAHPEGKVKIQLRNAK